jgi:hypothetical protein
MPVPIGEGEELYSNILSQTCAAPLRCNSKRFYAAASRRARRLPTIKESSSVSDSGGTILPTAVSLGPRAAEANLVE